MNTLHQRAKDLFLAALDRAGVDEGHEVEVIVGADGNLVFDAVEELELAGAGRGVVRLVRGADRSAR